MIREIALDEVSIIHDLAHIVWPPTFRDILSPDQINYMLNWMYSLDSLSEQITAGHTFFVLEESNQPIGFMGVEVDCPLEGVLKVHKLYVLPSYHGKGKGYELMNHAFKVAKEANCKYVTLNVNRFNNAVDFYTRVGFKIEKSEDIDIGNGYLMEDYVMTKAVPQ